MISSTPVRDLRWQPATKTLFVQVGDDVSISIGCSPHQHEGFALHQLQLHKRSVDSRRRQLLVAQGERTTKGFELSLTHPNLYTWENLKEHLEAAHAHADQGDELASRIAVGFFNHNWRTLQDALQRLPKTP